MRGRGLAAIDEIVAIVSPDSDRAPDRLQQWSTDHGLDLSTVDVGDPIDLEGNHRIGVLGVSIGGDGTFLEGIKQFAPRNIPMFGINTGTLTFLARVEPAKLDEALTEIVQGRATIEERLQFSVEGPDIDATGINDVVLQNPPLDTPVERKITKLEVFVDGEYVGEYDGTGVAIATPTGATGLSLSANGPIHDPQNNSTLQIVPLHTHKMGVRPIVVGDETTIDIVVRQAADLLVDGGRHHAHLSQGDTVRITGDDSTAKIVRTTYDDDFYAAISEMLGWGIRDPGPRSTPPRTEGEAGVTDEVREQALKVATEAAKSVGEPLRELHGRTESVTYKTDAADIVTEADYISENIITTALDQEFPTHSIRSEEAGQIRRDTAYTWLVDPLDGTGNYANGNPNYCVSVALLYEGDPVVGVVYAPETDELWTACKGGTARRDGQPITTTDRSAIAESMLMSGYDPDGTFLTHFYQDARGVRRLGATALHLCYLASGSADAIWEYDTYPWDVAAGIVIAEAAGATLTDTDGEPFTLPGTDERSPLIGTNGALHETMLDQLGQNHRLSQ